MKSIIAIIATFIIMIAITPYVVSSSSDDTIDCQSFDPSKIKLVTFDVFAALMDLTTSLEQSIAAIVPQLTSDQVASFTQDWEGGYGNYAGYVFDEDVTGSHPFQYVMTKTLDDILTANPSYNISSNQYNDLLNAWSQLVPWKNTKDALQKVYNAHYEIGTLSNGDKDTLAKAMQVFGPNIKFSYFFSSDFPNAGSFKPDTRMYNQLSLTTNYTAEQILHVAGAPIDGWGAREAGLYSALVNPVPYPKRPIPCFLLKDMSDVPGILGL